MAGENATSNNKVPSHSTSITPLLSGVEGPEDPSRHWRSAEGRSVSRSSDTALPDGAGPCLPRGCVPRAQGLLDFLPDGGAAVAENKVRPLADLGTAGTVGSLCDPLGEPHCTVVAKERAISQKPG